MNKPETKSSEVHILRLFILSILPELGPDRKAEAEDVLVRSEIAEATHAIVKREITELTSGIPDWPSKRWLEQAVIGEIMYRHREVPLSGKAVSYLVKRAFKEAARGSH